MSYFKKFGDFCSGFAAFTGIIFLLSRFMSSYFGEEPIGMLEKLKMFFDKKLYPDYHLMTCLIISLIASVVFGRLLARLPYIAVLFCIPPVIITVCMYKMSIIAEYPMLYVVLTVVAFITAVADCIWADKKDGKHRGAYAGDVVSLFFSAFCIWTARKYSALSVLEADPENPHSFFENHMLEGGTDIELKLLYALAVLYAVLAVVSFILRDIYFIDAVLVVPPAIFLIYMWGAGKLLLLPEAIVTLALLTALVRIIPAISSRAGNQKKQIL